MKKAFKLSIAMAMLAAGIFTLPACKKDKTNEPVVTNPGGGNDGPKEKLKTERGAIDGSPIQKTIGAAGGFIETPDHAVKVTIPAGAVEGDVAFTIQPVKNTMGIMGLGANAYRLLPEGVNFKQDVEVSIIYTDSMIKGTVPEQLSLAFQDAEGYWQRPKGVTLDKGNRTLKVKTRHFSDWLPSAHVMLVNYGKESLYADEEAELKVMMHNVIPEDYGERVDYFMEPFELEAKHVVKWKVFGDGRVIMKAGSMEATYKAPSEIKGEVVAIVEVELTGLNDNVNGGANGFSTYLSTEIKLIPDEYVTWTVDGVTYNQFIKSAAISNGIAIITGTTAAGQSVALNVSSVKPGNFPTGETGKESKKSEIQLSADGKVYRTKYVKCNTFETVIGGGSVNFGDVGPVGGYIYGYFNGTVYYYSNCKESSKKVSGSFRVKRSG